METQRSAETGGQIILRKGSQPSIKGPDAWFTGVVRIDPLFLFRVMFQILQGIQIYIKLLLHFIHLIYFFIIFLRLSGNTFLPENCLSRFQNSLSACLDAGFIRFRLLF